MQPIVMERFITNAYKTHKFANIVRKLITSRSRLSLEVFLVKGLPQIYWEVYEI
jgi:hypothetical protein